MSCSYSIYLLCGVVVRRYWLLVDCWEGMGYTKNMGVCRVLLFFFVFFVCFFFCFFNMF